MQTFWESGEELRALTALAALDCVERTAQNSLQHPWTP